MITCKECKWWEGEKNFIWRMGKCLNPKLGPCYPDKTEEGLEDALRHWGAKDADFSLSSFLAVGRDFGCIHGEKKV